MTAPRLKADFNGLFGDLLCLSHGDTCEDEFDNTVALAPGMIVTAFDLDSDREGNSDEIFACGTVEPSPDWLQCKGSRWVLRLDGRGIRWKSDEEDT